MALTLVTGPAADPVSLADVKAHLRIDGALEDATLLAYVQAARLHLEGRDGWLNRALITQTWDYTLDRFPITVCGASWDPTIYVPLPPLQSVTSITYTDTNGAPQVLAPTEYDIDTKADPGRIVPAYGKYWPATRAVVNAVTVRFVAGYGAGAAAIPRPIRLALLGLVGDYNEHRDTDGPTPKWIEALLAPFRSWKF